uniref:RING-type domain-containing protein n=1 Tax=Ditylenchus dipsaci TaxID=166011 RepID=A0A915DK76_9BILA
MVKHFYSRYYLVSIHLQLLFCSVDYEPHNFGLNAAFAQPNANPLMPYLLQPQQIYNNQMFGYMNRPNLPFPTPNGLQQQQRQQVPARNVYIKKELRELFPDLDLSTLPRFPPHTPVDEEIGYVLENRHLFKKRISGNNGVKRKLAEEEPGTSKSDQPKRFRRAEGDGMMLSAFCEGFFELYETECLLASGDHKDKEIIKILLHTNFSLCNNNLIDHLIDKFSSNYLPSAVICFFVQSRFAYLVRKCGFRDIKDSDWISMITPKTDQSPVVEKEEKDSQPPELNNMITQSVKKFDDFMALARLNYPKLFDGQNAANLLEEIFECTVCFEEFLEDLVYLAAQTVSLRVSPQKKLRIKNPVHLDLNIKKGCICLRKFCYTAIGYRCKRCAFAKEMDVSKEEVKVFSCLSCQYEYCRICDREWTDDHFGKKCIEVAQREEKDKKDRKKYCFTA